MVWIRVDDSLFREPWFIDLSEGAKLAYLALASAGATRDPAGWWPSRAHLEATVPVWIIGHVDEMVRGELVSDGPDGLMVRRRTFYPSETPGAIRVRRHRERERYGNAHGGVTAGVTPSFSLSSSSSSSSSPLERPEASHAPAHTHARETHPPDPFEADPGETEVFVWLARNVGYVPEHTKMGQRVIALTEKLGHRVVLERLERLRSSGHLDPGDISGYVFGVLDSFRAPAPRLREDEVSPEQHRHREELRARGLAIAAEEESKREARLRIEHPEWFSDGR